jgi:hypothetical protein
MSLLHAARRLARRFGLEVPLRLRCTRTRRVRVLDGLHRVDGVFDVGANDGGYKERAAGFAGATLSFEPLAAAHASRAVAQGRPALAQHAALRAGCPPGEADARGWQLSRSLLPMLTPIMRLRPIRPR